MTRDEYLQAVSQFIHSNIRADAGMKASTLGNLLLRSLPESWHRHDFTALKDVLQELERRGIVRIDNDAKGALAVWAIGARAPAANGQPSDKRLRKDVWAAFVNALPHGRRFFQRSSGEIVQGQVEPPSSTAGWIEIPRITDDTQKSWARDFLETRQPDLRPILNQATWFLRLPEEFRRINSSLLPQWHAHRSKHVIEFVALWAKDNAIDMAHLIENSQALRRKAKPEYDMRRRILSAIERMTTEELMDIPIRARHFFPSDTPQNT
jgi:hypothetical protein